jgi:RES domain
VIFYRHVDPRFPFLWESSDQPPARWHAAGDGPVQYLSSTPDAAWAEFLRHEEIIDAADVAGIERSLWAIDVAEPPQARPRLNREVLLGEDDSYPACRAEASRLRAGGAAGLLAPSAAVAEETPSGFRTRGGLRGGPRRRESVVVLFGRRPDLVGWAACDRGRPRVDLLGRVRHFGRSAS